MDFTTETPGTIRDIASEEQPSSQPINAKIQAKFQIALPPTKSSQIFRLSPKLLVQLQQLRPNHRPVPILEIWQPPLRRSKLTKDFPQPLKLGTRDIYATLNEPYITNKQPYRQDRLQGQDTQSNDIQEKDIVAAICQASSSDNPTSSIHFRDTKCIWQVGANSAGPGKDTCYRFVIEKESTTNPEQCRMIMQWEKRVLSENGSAASGSLGNEEFALFTIDRKTRRQYRIATMTRAGFEITVRKSSILDRLRTCMALMEPVSEDTTKLETWLYTLVLTLGVSVASQEGWFD
ncbi:hypothetical protein ACN38_g414 [Penicillium nordicum]|uniref:Uncharacterized protein n=1 Tax=Penicillium nordicum TaxID=229535 RepID=A0A0M8PAI0_9EURO|nr:hypothetical protein ACN38_g414 [Penicillium nordicum]